MGKFSGILLIITFTLNIMSCGRNGVSNEIIAKAEKELPMEVNDTKNESTKRINLQTVSFDKPEGFEDKSNYGVFIKPKYSDDLKKRLVGSELERVSVAHFKRGEEVSDGKDAVKVTDIESARKSFHQEIEGLKREAKNLYGIKSLTIKIESFMEKESLSKEKFPTLMTGQVMGEVGKEMDYRREAYVFDTQQTFFYLLYITHEDGEKIQQRFERMVESMELNTPNFAGDAPTGDGYFRRYAGDVTLEVPTDLIPDRKFVYEKHFQKIQTDNLLTDDANMTLMSVIEPDDQNLLLNIDYQTINYKATMRTFLEGDIKDSTNPIFKSNYYDGVITKNIMVVNEGYTSKYVYKTISLRVKLKDHQGNLLILVAATRIDHEKELTE